MNEISFVDENIKDKIYVIRGKQVMLDSDLAKLYKCKNGTKTINLAVKRNINRFPEDFYFQLTEEEVSRFQFETLNIKRGQNIKYLPHAFTEQGVAMLASVLRTEVADKISVNIMRAFVAMRHIILNSMDYQKKLFIMQSKIIEHDNKLIEYDSKFEEIFNKFNTEDVFNGKLLFKDQFYDGYSFILDILNEAKEDVLIIDNYCDKKVLDLICNLNIRVTIISKNMNNELIDKYQKQYNNLIIIQNDSFHDRFIIIDKNKGYYLGSSIKDIGSKISYIDTIDEKWIEELLKEL